MQALLTPQSHQRLNRELLVWNVLRHPNIVELYGTCSDMGHYSAMVSPWYPKGSAPQFLKHLGDDATLYVRLRLLTEIAAGLEYRTLFTHQIYDLFTGYLAIVHRFTPTVVHGDIKGANILISDDHEACLCDFGLSGVVGEVAGSSNFTSTFAGSLRWTAPELIQHSEESGDPLHVTTWSDIYALGSVTYEVFRVLSPHILLIMGINETATAPDRACPIPYSQNRHPGVCIQAHMRHTYELSDSPLPSQVMFDVIKNIRPVRPSPAEAAVPISDSHWNFIESCWRAQPLERPPISIASPALEAMYCEVQPPWRLSLTRRSADGSGQPRQLTYPSVS